MKGHHSETRSFIYSRSRIPVVADTDVACFRDEHVPLTPGHWGSVPFSPGWGAPYGSLFGLSVPSRYPSREEEESFAIWRKAVS